MTHSTKIQLIAYIPGLIPASTMLAPLLADMAMPGLGTLLARAKFTRHTGIDSLHGALYAALGITRQTDWPVAPITLLRDGHAPEKAHWYRADPVHLQPARDQLMLVDQAAFALDASEATQLVDAFNQHFCDRACRLLAPHPKRWYLQTAHPPRIRTHSLRSASGQAINQLLPQGEDALDWHRLYNEIQMLFFNLPVNAARESRGELPVNSLWCWGGGILPVQTAKKDGFLWSTDSDLCAVAEFSHIPYAAPPEQAKLIRQSGMLLLDALEGSAQYGDYTTWRENLLQLEQHWFVPWLTQLKRAELDSLEIWSEYAGQVLSWRITRRDILRFWRRAGLTQSLAVG
jgi:hypothetical protein